MPRKGETERWVTGTHREHNKANTLERHFSAGSSGDAERRGCTKVEVLESRDSIITF